MENLLERAFKELYPSRQGYTFELEYGRMHGYNGRISLRWKHIKCNLSGKWQTVSEDIQIGMIQHLLSRLFKTKKETMNMSLYNSFIRNLHLSIPKTKIDRTLLESFKRMNSLYLDNSVELPNLVFSGESTRELGSYNYKTDTIKISTIFKELPEKFLDYVMFHEMLHKKHKFKDKNGRSFHHTSAFKKDERRFEDQADVEKQLNNALRGLQATKKKKWSFFDYF